MAPATPSDEALPRSGYVSVALGGGYADSTSGPKCNALGAGLAVRVGYTLPASARLYLGAAFDYYFGCETPVWAGDGRPRSELVPNAMRTRLVSGELGFDVAAGSVAFRPFLVAGLRTRTGCSTNISCADQSEDVFAPGVGLRLIGVFGRFNFGMEGRALYPIDDESFDLAFNVLLGAMIW